jgi:RNA polymerase sigma factor (sigma-70 family)
MESMSGQAARLPVELPPRAGTLRLGDARLARLAARGDRRALEAIYRRHHQELYRYCRAILRDPHDAEDALQATMTKVAAALPGETREISLRPWLFRIAHNEAISILRARRDEAELDQRLPDLGADIELEAEQRDRLRQLIRDLDLLPERQRGALVMRELSGFSFTELGAAFAISPEAAKQAVYEARVALQEMNQGREMDCKSVRKAISDGDRRRLRGRRLRAHLNDCDACADFAAAIDRRRGDLAALAPPIALPAALAALHAAVGGGSTGAAAGGAAGAGSATGLGAALGGSAAVKSAAVVIAAAAIAGGGAEVGGLIDLNGGGGSADHGAASAPVRADHPAVPGPTDAASQPVAQQPARAASAGSDRAGVKRGGRGEEGGKRGHGQGHQHAPAAAAEHSASGAGASPPGLTQTPPGQASVPPGQSSGQGQVAGNGQGATSPSISHSNPQAQANSSSASHSQAASAADGGGTATAPGQTGAVGPVLNGSNVYGQTDKPIK